MIAFAYPKSKHQRTQTPDSYTDYRRYKPALRIEFGDRCVYCRTPAPVKGLDQFGADHYRPQSLFPELSTEYLNLYYCCNTCNCWKGTYWPKGGREKSEFIPNPCEHVMFQHMRVSHDGTVEFRSPAGKVAVTMLHLNDELTVRWRRAASYYVDKLRGEEAQLAKKIAAVEKKRKGGHLAAQEAAKATSLFAAELQKVRDYLALYCEVPA